MNVTLTEIVIVFCAVFFLAMWIIAMGDGDGPNGY